MRMVSTEKRTPERRLRMFLCSAWVLVSVAPAVTAGVALAYSVVHSSYSGENRAPEVRIVVAALALVAGLAAVSAALRQRLDRGGRAWLLAGGLMFLSSLLLVALWVIVDAITTGRT
jgi:hypothetical protein